jgi:hypothetical protein
MVMECEVIVVITRREGLVAIVMAGGGLYAPRHHRHTFMEPCLPEAITDSCPDRTHDEATRL